MMMGNMLHTLLLILIVTISVILASPDAIVTHEVTFDISINGKSAGILIIGLFGTIVPRTVKNFVTLAKRSGRNGYIGTKFHRVIEDFIIQGGDFDQRDGSGTESIYGDYFDDENFDMKHYGPGWVGMANNGPNTNGNQFYIVSKRTPWLDGSNVVFGKVIEGMDLVKSIQELDTDSRDWPLVDVLIDDSMVDYISPPYVIEKS
ncbi:peptidyl-prolyl cis-trans isomerase 6-like [Antedon mediterranea]|uniref:peptidyl-prolyl cis-trans isomerase 6-like n=1 Tax=Antedon mediterranea TaxID=105859 RepID=UPI003AF9E0CC